MMSDLPDRDHITHDDCTKIIAAYQTGRLIDRESIDYEAALYAYNDASNPGVEASYKGVVAAVDAALGIKGDTT